MAKVGSGRHAVLWYCLLNVRSLTNGMMRFGYALHCFHFDWWSLNKTIPTYLLTTTYSMLCRLGYYISDINRYLFKIPFLFYVTLHNGTEKHTTLHQKILNYFTIYITILYYTVLHYTILYYRLVPYYLYFLFLKNRHFWKSCVHTLESSLA